MIHNKKTMDMCNVLTNLPDINNLYSWFYSNENDSENKLIAIKATISYLGNYNWIVNDGNYPQSTIIWRGDIPVKISIAKKDESYVDYIILNETVLLPGQSIILSTHNIHIEKVSSTKGEISLCMCEKKGAFQKQSVPESILEKYPTNTQLSHTRFLPSLYHLDSKKESHDMDIKGGLLFPSDTFVEKIVVNPLHTDQTSDELSKYYTKEISITKPPSTHKMVDELFTNAAITIKLESEHCDSSVSSRDKYRAYDSNMMNMGFVPKHPSTIHQRK